MEWLVIAVIVAIVVGVGASLAIRQFWLKKDNSKAPFKKTYATAVKSKETSSEKDPSEEDSAKAQSNISSEKVMKTTSEDPSSQSATALPSSDQMPSISPSGDSVSVVPLKSAVAAAQLEQPLLKPSVSATTTAQLSEEDSTTESKPAETAAEVTEADIEPVQEKTEEQAPKDSAHFITEIESDPVPAEDSIPRPPEESVKPAPPLQADKAVIKEEREKTKKTAPKSTKPKLSSKVEPQITVSRPAQSSPAKAEAPKTDTMIDQPSQVVAEEMPKTIKTDLDIIDTVEEPPNKTNQVSESDTNERVMEILNNGKLEDLVSLAKTALSLDHYQTVFHKIIKTTYPKRKESKMRTLFRTHAQRYVDDFDPTTPPDTTSEYIFKCLAIVLQEEKEYAKAIALCRKALELGLDDGTKTGYPGRIERLKKSQKSK